MYNALFSSLFSFLSRYNGKNKNFHVQEFINWEYDDIIEWIMSLENGVFIKYKEKLTDNLNSNNINGSILMSITLDDIHDWGIDDYNHMKKLFEHITAITHLEGQ